MSRWYKRFDSGDITLEDRPRSKRPTVVNDNDLQDALKARLEADTCMLAKTLDCDQAAIVKHLHGFGYCKIVPTWVPHEWRGFEACRMSIVESLFLRPHRKDFLKDIVTGDESWVLCRGLTE
ncbi:hypothetical protein Y032_0006g3127 [Ancylostoma ceylanicum]|uniref:Mos1 transposase HTH domain-containing protein n=1 Tax=Ancylostoma ceylanicum TaxID=53326 RepID=A0A016VQJ6_9BILA|nr:hypothetical protein Y032_0006g3127 [Ancylostoma ceylanicum]